MANWDKPGVFISYSQHDKPMMLELVKHLSTFEASVWYDLNMVGGEEWQRTLDDRLDSAEITLLLVSSNFFASEFCQKIELPRAMERQRKGETIIIPIIIKAYDWENSPISRFQILPSTREPIENWKIQNEAFLNVVKGIRKTIAKARLESESAQQSKKPLPPKEKLPYLCDRSEQEDKLAKTLTPHLKTKAARPVICLVHGDVREAHSEFLDRLKNIWLPDFLKTGSGARKHVIEAPNDEDFWGKIGKVMDGYPVTKEDVWPFIAHHSEPLMFVLNLRMREDAAYSEAVIKSLLKFCHAWDDLPASRFVIFFVCVKYDSFSLLEFKKKSLQNNLRQNLKRLETGEPQKDDGIKLSDFPKVTGVVLPELESIRETHVDVWSQQYHPLPDHKIRALFKDGSIPMELLAEKLEKLMSSSDK